MEVFPITFNRPYGTQSTDNTFFGPSSELLGYCRTPLRGEISSHINKDENWAK